MKTQGSGFERCRMQVWSGGWNHGCTLHFIYLSRDQHSRQFFQRFSFWNPAWKQPAEGRLFSGFKAESACPLGTHSRLWSSYWELLPIFL